MRIDVDLQIADDSAAAVLPDLETIKDWATAALETGGRTKDSELTVRMVSPDEIQRLNLKYRHIDRPTNILSFPFDCPKGIELPLIGDLIICDKILKQEAKEQRKSVKEHFAHLIVHGCLHLIGYDHIEEEDARIMEPLEIKALKRLGFGNPYADDEF